MTAQESVRLRALIDELVSELSARDPELLGTLSASVPEVADLPSKVQDLYAEGRRYFSEVAFTLTTGPTDALGAVISSGLVDAARAALGQLELEPRPSEQRDIATILRAEYERTTLPSGRSMYVARWAGRPLLVINAIGVPLGPWHALIADQRGPFRPIVVETRASELLGGGMGSDSSLLEYAADLAEALKLTDFTEVDVLAWCNGGRIAVELAHRVAERIGVITLLSTTMRSAQHRSPTSSSFEDNLEKVFEGVRKSPKSAALMSRLLLQLFSPPNWDTFAGNAAALADALFARSRQEHARDLSRPMQTGPDLVNYAARTQLDEAYPLHEALAGLPVPVLLLLGDRDGIVDNAGAERAVSAAPRWLSLTLSGAGHYIADLQYPYLRCVLTRFSRERERARFNDLARVVRQQSGNRVAALPEWSYLAATRGGKRQPLARLFEHAAALRPDADAIADGEVTLSFAELSRGAKQLGQQLRQRGVRPGDAVCVLAEKRAIMAVAAGGIWNAHAVYVPLDHDNPPERTRELLARVQPRALVGSTAALSKLPTEGLATFAFDDILKGCHGATAAGAEPADAAMDETAPAYVIFTSGSTGVPKGVTISQGSLLDYFHNHNQVLRFGPSSRVLSFSPFHFDVSIEDTLLPLSLGAFVYQFRGMQVAPLIRKVLKRERITHLIAVSSLLALASAQGEAIDTAAYPHLQMVMTGAESCDPRVIDRWVTGLPGARVINAYGPTEATIVCLTHTVERAEPERHATYPIGLPLPNVKVRLVGDGDEIVTAPGKPGELWVGGSQVMLGYLGLAEASAAVCLVVDGERWYKTGDLCELDAEGRYVYLQRLDDMVKISGKRIHLGEIRHRALAIPGVAQTAVGLAVANERPVIGLVVVSDSEPTAGAAQIRESLARHLPAYMVPGVIGMARAPRLTPNGKTDEKGMILALQAMILERGLVDGSLELHASGAQELKS